MTYIPVRFRGECHYCHDPIDTRASGVCQWVEGWVENRTGGGAHAIRKPIRHQRYACKWCVDADVGKASTSQLGLFG